MVRELNMMGLELSHDELKFMKTKNLSSFCFLNFTRLTIISILLFIITGSICKQIQGGAVDKLISLFWMVFILFLLS